ncbi:MAG: hypothetical protein NUV60_01245 [Patescibacteria group bacterium]|nr:hypothetical protein [Patescibacteria group bacterium]
MQTDSAFRNSLRNVHGLAPHEMTSYGDALNRALEKHTKEHPDEGTLTSKNFDKVVQHMHEDAHYRSAVHTSSAKTGAWESALRSSLKMPPADAD